MRKMVLLIILTLIGSTKMVHANSVEKSDCDANKKEIEEFIGSSDGVLLGSFTGKAFSPENSGVSGAFFQIEKLWGIKTKTPIIIISMDKSSEFRKADDIWRQIKDELEKKDSILTNKKFLAFAYEPVNFGKHQIVGTLYCGGIREVKPEEENIIVKKIEVHFK